MARINAATGSDVAILFLAYTLAPYAHYPRQLIQGVELLRYVLNDLNRKPENIIIGGDSAGGNLTSGILSHLSHPHPSIAPLELSAPLRGIVLLAPWTSFDPGAWESVKYNQYKDTVTPASSNRWSDNFLGGKPRDEYNEPMTADPEWWRGLKAEEVLVVCGSDEILVDSIKVFTGKVKVSAYLLLPSCLGAGKPLARSLQTLLMQFLIPRGKSLLRSSILFFLFTP